MRPRVVTQLFYEIIKDRILSSGSLICGIYVILILSLSLSS